MNNPHKNARTTPLGRAEMVRRIVAERRPLAEVAAGLGISERTARKWLARWRSAGEAGLENRSSRPLSSRHGFSAFWRSTAERLRRDYRLTGAEIAEKLTLARSTVAGWLTRMGLMNSLQQQARFDAFLTEFNTERPHEALAMKCPAELYTPSARRYAGLPDLAYPLHDRDVLVTACGRICLHRKKINISTVFAGQRLGIKEVDDGIWIVSFMRYDLGFIDLEQRTLQPLDNPFGPRLSPMS